jgi:hypothetical protein
MTNHAAFAYADVPLFLFHLLEFSGIDYELDVEELNTRWANPAFIDSWSQLVIKHTASNVDIITHAPPAASIAWRKTARCPITALITSARTSNRKTKPSSCASAGRATTVTKAQIWAS